MSSTSAGADKSIAIHGHISATPELFAGIFGARVSDSSELEADCAIFAINPSAGIDPATIELWKSYDEVQMPRLVVVTVLDGMELDFDDAVMVGNRVFDKLVTPYLVLHGENGTPIGTISLRDLSTVDYSTTPPTIGQSDHELAELVDEFRIEFLEETEEFGDGAFAAGLLFPAIPVNPANTLGIEIVTQYLSELPSRD
jgi:translation elongation factor EF-G